MALYDKCVTARKSDYFDLAPVWARKEIIRGKIHGPTTPLPPYAVGVLNAALAEISKCNGYHHRKEDEVSRIPTGYQGHRKKQRGRKTKKENAA